MELNNSTVLQYVYILIVKTCVIMYLDSEDVCNNNVS